MAEAVGFPDVPEDVTPAWLSRALSTTIPDVEVRAITVLDQHSGTTGRLRLGLDYADGPCGPETVFVKLPPFDASQRRLVAGTDMGRSEARFYAGPASEVPVRAPRSYYAAAGDEPTEYVMVLEDLASAGVSFSSLFEPHADTHGLQTVEALARLHAHFWNDERFAGELSWIRPPMRGSLGAKLIDSAREQFGDDQPPVFTALCRLFVDHHETIVDLWDEGEQTLIHGDTHAGNHFVEGDGVGFYDWAVLSRAPGIRDVAIYLGNSCPTDVRRREQDAWIKAYRDVLVDAGVDAPSFEVLWDRYRRAALYGWVSATAAAAMGSKWQDVDVTQLATARATAACDDLDTIGAFTSLL